MVSYKVVLTDDALSMLNAAVDYVALELQNPMAADAIYTDALDTINELENIAGSLRIIALPSLAALEYRKMLFKRHDYVFIYKLYGITAVIEGVFHQSEDYENKFAKLITS